MPKKNESSLYNNELSFNILSPEYFSWSLQGVCKNFGPVGEADLFFANAKRYQNQAKLYCKVCPVARECLAFAVKYPFLEGIWGCSDEAERKQIVDIDVFLKDKLFTL